MSNFVEIANLAGTLIGTAARITDPADNRLLARTVRAVWDLQRRATIRDGDFNFASQRYQLPALAITVPHPYARAFEMPAEALALKELLDRPEADYRLEGRQILTDLGAPLAVRCVVDVPEPALWDECFADAFAKRLAWTCGRKIAGSAYNTAEGEQIYRAAIGATKSVDARENGPIQQAESGWVEARYAGSYADPTRWG